MKVSIQFNEAEQNAVLKDQIVLNKIFEELVFPAESLSYDLCQQFGAPIGHIEEMVGTFPNGQTCRLGPTMLTLSNDDK